MSDTPFARLSSIYGKNHFELDSPFQAMLRYFNAQDPRLRELGEYAGKELYEVSDYVEKYARPRLVTWSIDGDRVDRVWLDPSQRRALEKLMKDFGVNRGPYSSNDWFYYFSSIYLIGDPGISCILTVTNQTAFAVFKYGDEAARSYLPGLTGQGGETLYGATWFTERQGGSDLGANTVLAEPREHDWKLEGDTKYFSSNAGVANCAIVTARPVGAKSGAKGLALFFVPEYDEKGRKNFSVRRLKEKSGTINVPTGEVEFHDTKAILLGEAGSGIYYTMENLMVSRLSNAVGALGIARKAYLEAYFYARKRKAFGKPLIEHPLVQRDLLETEVYIEGTSALTFKAISEFQATYLERPPYSERYHYARLLTHISKNLTADMAAEVTKVAMELHGGIGFLSEFPVERWHREALITPIWEGPSNIQALDMLEAMTKKGSHLTLIKDLETMGGGVKEGRELYVSALGRVRGKLEDLGKMGGEEAQFNAKEALKVLGHSTAVMVLVHMGNVLKMKRFIDVATIYNGMFLSGDLLPKELMRKEAPAILEVDRVDRRVFENE